MKGASLLVVASLALSSSVFLRAQQPPVGQTIKVEDLKVLETDVNERLNLAIRSGQAGKETTVVHTKAYKDVVDTTVYKHKDGKTLVPLKLDELQYVRDALNRKFDAIHMSGGRLNPKTDAIALPSADLAKDVALSGRLKIK